jgi:hypothetical protein
MAYKLHLPPSLAWFHNVFHLPQLKKCLKAPVDVVLPDVALLKADLSYPEHSIKVLNHKDRVPRRKMIKFYKVQWSHHFEEVLHPDFKAKTECISLCVPGLISTHKATNSEINSITSVYYIKFDYKTYYKTKRSKQRNKAPHHRQITRAPHA